VASPAQTNQRKLGGIVTQPKISLRNVTKSFGTNTVLRDLSLDAATGEVVSLIGASGSGKTTILRCINLLEQIDDGRILLDGDEISEVGRDPNPIRRRVGIVFQSFNLFPHMSVNRNITLSLTKVLGQPRDVAEERARELLARFGLSEKSDVFPDQLSGGQQQRVAIIRALAMKPEVLLLDEITSALDPELVGEVLDVVRELKGSGITLMIATHEMAFAREISDRVCFLHAGTVAEIGTPSRIFGYPQDERTRQFLRRVRSH
jgi:polar amino acid transport system ATP-binding protein